MENFLFSAIVVVLILILVRRDPLSPASFFGIVSALNGITFYIGSILHLFPQTMRFWYYISQDYSDVNAKVLLFYLSLSLLGYTIDLTIKRTSLRRGKLINIDNIRLGKYLESPYLLIVLFSVWLLILWHLRNVNIPKMLFYTTYLEVRDPDKVGLTNDLLATIHTFLPTLGMLISPLVVYFYARHRWAHFIVVLLLFVYSLLFTIAIGSRFILIYLSLITLTVFLMRKKITISVVLFALLTFITYGTLMAQRYVNVAYGIRPFFDVLFSGKFLVLEYYLFSIYNFFGGGFVMAEAFQRERLFYPLRYKVLSFSPLPSIIDGFSKIRHYEHRVIPTGPFNSFAEAYHFGWGFLIFLIVFLAILLYQATKFWRRANTPIYVFILLFPLYYAVLRMQIYQLRQVFRWFVLALLIAVVMNALTHRKKISKFRRQAREYKDGL